MRIEDRTQFPPVRETLRDGRPVALRFLQQDDGDRLAAFYAAIPRAHTRFYCPYELTASQARQNAARADDPLRVVLVLEDERDGSIGGYAWYRWRGPEASASSFGICVRSDFQGAGAGRCLMERLLQIARVIGPPVMQLTVQVANAAAVHLYRSLGFEVVREQLRPERHGFAAEPEYAMSRGVRPDEGSGA